MNFYGVREFKFKGMRGDFFGYCKSSEPFKVEFVGGSSGLHMSTEEPYVISNIKLECRSSILISLFCIDGLSLGHFRLEVVIKVS